MHIQPHSHINREKIVEENQSNLIKTASIWNLANKLGKKIIRENSMGKATKMLISVPDMIRNPFAQIVQQKFFQIKTVIFVVCLNYCLKTCVVCAGPTIQQEQELLLLEALSKRQPSYYGTSNSLMDILGQSMCSVLFRNCF